MFQCIERNQLLKPVFLTVHGEEISMWTFGEKL